MMEYTAYSHKTKIGVITDLHYTHPSLIVEKGNALDAYLGQDRKLLLESDAILRRSIDALLQENVDVVLVPGDLTKDGEKVSHYGVAQLLDALRVEGVKVLVIPGNHDINNPDAVSFHGDTTHQEPTISADDFETIYTNFGYGDALSKDKHSLSYVSEPVEGLRILCIDSNRYNENKFIAKGDDCDLCVTHGAIKSETIEWIRKEMYLAKILNKQVVAMMHHNVVEHFTHQGLFAAPYMVDNFAVVQKIFLECGIKVLFTGHFHSSDIAMVEDAHGNKLYEVETGSIVTYPSAYRIVEVSELEIGIETKYIKEIDFSLPEGVTFPVHSKCMIEYGIHEMLAGFVQEFHPTFGNYLPGWTRSFIAIPNSQVLTDLLQTHLAPQAIGMMLAHYSGNEELTDDVVWRKESAIDGIDNFIRSLAKASAGKFAGIVESIIQRMGVVRKAKEAVSSIWDNKAVRRQNDDGLSYSALAIDDLQLSVALNDVEEFIQNKDIHFSFSL